MCRFQQAEAELAKARELIEEEAAAKFKASRKSRSARRSNPRRGVFLVAVSGLGAGQLDPFRTNLSVGETSPSLEEVHELTTFPVRFLAQGSAPLRIIVSLRSSPDLESRGLQLESSRAEEVGHLRVRRDHQANMLLAEARGAARAEEEARLQASRERGSDSIHHIEIVLARSC